MVSINPTTTILTTFAVIRENAIRRREPTRRAAIAVSPELISIMARAAAMITSACEASVVLLSTVSGLVPEASKLIGIRATVYTRDTQHIASRQTTRRIRVVASLYIRALTMLVTSRPSHTFDFRKSRLRTITAAVNTATSQHVMTIADAATGNSPASSSRPNAKLFPPIIGSTISA